VALGESAEHLCEIAISLILSLVQTDEKVALLLQQSGQFRSSGGGYSAEWQHLFVDYLVELGPMGNSKNVGI